MRTATLILALLTACGPAVDLDAEPRDLPSFAPNLPLDDVKPHECIAGEIGNIGCACVDPGQGCWEGTCIDNVCSCSFLGEYACPCNQGECDLGLACIQGTCW